MHKYLALFRNCWLDALMYRAESLVWLVSDTMPSLIMLTLWLAVYRTRNAIEGYTLPMMLIYYLGMALMETLLTPHCEEWLSWEIREGRLSIFLTRPISIIAYFMLTELAWRVLRFFLLLIPSSIVLFKLLPSYISLPRLGFGQTLVLLLALPFSYLLHFFIKFTLGSIAFWLIEPRGLFNFVYIANSIFSGAFLPLDLFPKMIVTLGNLLPFKYIYYFPLSVALGKVAGSNLVLGLMAQGLWMVVFYFIMLIVWRKGLRRYAATGG